MTSDESWVCPVGGHWACARCAPNMCCRAHANPRPIKCLPTKSLWYNSVKESLKLKVVCAYGCVNTADKSHSCADCKRLTFGSISAGSLGFYKDAKIYNAICNRKNVYRKNNIAILLSSVPMRVELLSDFRAFETSRRLHCTAQLGGATVQFATLPLKDQRIGDVVKLSPVEPLTEREVDYVALFWANIILTDVYLN